MKKLLLTVSGVMAVFCLLPCHAEAQWTQAGTYTNNDYINSLAVNTTTLFAAPGFGGIYRSTDNGTTWTYNGGVNTTIGSFVLIGTNLFAGTGHGVFLSTDNGTTWTQVNTGLTNTSVRALTAAGTNLFAATDFGIFLSTNSGTTWTEQTNTGLPGSTIFALAAIGTNLFIGTDVAGVFLSTNNGTSWTPVNTGLPSFVYYSRVLSLAAFGTNLFAGTIDRGAFLSTNNGASWTPVNTGLTSITVYAFAAAGTNLFAGTGGYGVFISTNNGTSWTPVNTGLVNRNAGSLAICNGNLFAGTSGNGVWRRPLSEMVTTSVHSSEDELPAQFTLAQNYPNPFNPSTTIEFSLPRFGFATMKVFNLLGEEVATLMNEVHPAGTYRIRWSASGLPSGVYFYRLQAGDFMETKKLTLLR